MNKNEAMQISAYIGRIIAEKSPYIEYSVNDIDKAYAEYDDDEIDALKKASYLDDDFEKFFVIREFCNSTGISDVSGSYLRRLFMLSKKLDADKFMQDPYLSHVKFNDVRRGNIFLTHAEYDRGEILQYDMPEITDSTVVPKLGFFTKKVRFPALYEGNIPWVSVCPSEINSMSEQIERAKGRVLVLGLGLGYYPYMISFKKSVESITIIELSDNVINIFNSALLPSFPHKDKITVIHDDAIEYLKTVGIDSFDFCFADIWEGVADGAGFYKQIKSSERRLVNTEFTYWIEKEIKEYIAGAQDQ